MRTPPNPIRGLTANSSRNASARTAVVGFSTTGLNTVTANGHSAYHALISTLSHRSDKAFFQASYTYSKSIDNNSGAATQDLGSSGGNQLAPQLQRGLSDFDRPQRLAVTYSYDLPGPSRGLLKTLIGGWNVSGTAYAQSSLPINFLCSCGSTNIDGITGTIYPSLLGNVSDIYNGSNWSSYTIPGNSAFKTGIVSVVPTLPAGAVLNGLNSNAAPGSNTYTVGGPGPAANNVAQLFGNMGRNPNLRGPFQNQFDVALLKTFQIKERLGFQLRGDAFNILNHPVFSNPNSNVGSAAFGRISSTVTNARILQVSAKLIF